jgi:hypothetical protein
MSTTFEKGSAKSFNLSTRVFLALLVINGLISLMAGTGFIFNRQNTLESINVKYSSDFDLFLVSGGTALLFLAGILALGFIWTMKRRAEGLIMGIAGGLYLFFLGLLPWIVLGWSQAFYVDSIRGGLMVIFAYLSYPSLQSKSVKG